jgi:hypothetical protein
VFPESNSLDWYWRFHFGLPPRPEDREDLTRIAPELFIEGRSCPSASRWQEDTDGFRAAVRQWLKTEDAPPFVSVRVGSCPSPDCPIKLGGGSDTPLAGSSELETSNADGNLLLRFMTVASGWNSKASVFFEAARKIRGGKGSVKELLLTDPYLFEDQGEDGTSGGIRRFLEYMDVLNVPRGAHLRVLIPPYAKGKKAEKSRIWKAQVETHAFSKNITVTFSYFRTRSNARFHDRFYLAKHQSGLISGLFGPSMNGLSDSSFALIGEVESETLRNLNKFIEIGLDGAFMFCSPKFAGVARNSNRRAS